MVIASIGIRIIALSIEATQKSVDEQRMSGQVTEKHKLLEHGRTIAAETLEFLEKSI